MTSKKRKLVVVLTFLFAILYSVYWFAVIGFIEDGFQSWIINEIKTNQADIQFEKITRSGFPFALTLTVDNLTYMQSQQNMVATVPTINFKVNPFNWYDTSYAFNDGATITSQQKGQTATISFKNLDGFMATSWNKTNTSFGLTIKTINLDLPPTKSHSTRTQMAFDQLNLAFAATPALPRILSQNTVSQWRDAGGVIVMNDTGVQNHPAILSINGDLALDLENQPFFKGHAFLVDGNTLLDKISKTRRFPEQNIKLVKSFMGSFEKTFSNPDGRGLKIPLSIKNGYASIGPFPFMPIPQLHWAEEQ